MRHALQQQQLITKVQPSPPVVNHIPSASQPCCIDEILANDIPQGSTLGIGIPFRPRGSNSRCTCVTLARCPFQSETAAEDIERATSQWMIDSGVIAHGERFSISRFVVCRAAMVVYEADLLHKTQCVITQGWFAKSIKFHNLVINLHDILCPSHIQPTILPKDDNEL